MSAAAVAVRERPILFSGPMVRAILDGRKTHTRRVVKAPRSDFATLDNCAVTTYAREAERLGPDVAPYLLSNETRGEYLVCNRVNDVGIHTIHCPYGQPGDRLWVREAWQVWTEFDDTAPRDLPTVARTHVNYPADGNRWDSRGRPSIHMPRWASRIALEITDVRVQRVQEISEEDARAEGCNGAEPADCVMAFGALWDSINATRGYGWDVNPWVFVLSFRRIA